MPKMAIPRRMSIVAILEEVLVVVFILRYCYVWLRYCYVWNIFLFFLSIMKVCGKIKYFI